RSAFSSAGDRIMALAGTAPAASIRRGSGGGTPETGPDRNLEAIQGQAQAIGGERFDLSIREAKTGQMVNREWSRAELEQSAPWLLRMNALGNDIYIRPAGEHGLVLVDGLKPEALERMKQKGYAPAATVETSPGNYQAWVKLSEKPLS